MGRPEWLALRGAGMIIVESLPYMVCAKGSPKAAIEFRWSVMVRILPVLGVSFV